MLLSNGQDGIVGGVDMIHWPGRLSKNLEAADPFASWTVAGAALGTGRVWAVGCCTWDTESAPRHTWALPDALSSRSWGKMIHI